MTKSSQTYQSVFIIPEKALPYFDRALEPYADAVLMSLLEKGSDKGKWKIEAIFNQKPDCHLLQVTLAVAALSAGIEEPQLNLIPKKKKNWLKESLSSFKPISIGRYYVYGSHIKNLSPNDKISLKIDASTAFGSGEHATTQGCLYLFDKLLENFTPKSILDMGCGSGILSMAAAKVLNENVSIDAVDIDSEAVNVTVENIRENNVSPYIRVWQSDGYEKINKTYDLIFENILARPLIEMAPKLFKHLNNGGYAILSGFLNRQKKWVMEAHQRAGFVCINQEKINEWGTVLVKKN